FRAISFKVSLSSALIATVSLLIIVVAVAVVVVGVVVIVAVVVVGGICRSASTVPGQMANPFAIIVPRPGQCSASYSAVAGTDYFQKYPQTFVCSQQHHGSSCPLVQWQIQLPPTLFLAWLPSRFHESCRVIHRCTSQPCQTLQETFGYTSVPIPKNGNCNLSHLCPWFLVPTTQFRAS
nr:hypothetical protein [Tanacetum cinerariifolium]